MPPVDVIRPIGVAELSLERYNQVTKNPNIQTSQFFNRQTVN